MKRKCPWRDIYTEEEVRKEIVQRHDEGMEIEEIAEISGYHIKSVNRIIQNFENKKTFKRRKGGGRHPKLTSSEKIAISNCLRSKPWTSCDRLKAQLNISASSQTLRRFIKSKGYRYKKPTTKPKLKNNDMEKRLDWAFEYRNMDFSNVIFADECSMWLREWNGKMWIKRGEEHYIENEAHPPKVHIWGAIGEQGVIAISVFEGNLNAAKFISILKDSLINEANAMYGKGRWILAQDNDPKHRAKKTQNFLHKEKVNFF